MRSETQLRAAYTAAKANLTVIQADGPALAAASNAALAALKAARDTELNARAAHQNWQIRESSASREVSQAERNLNDANIFAPY